MAEIVPAIPGLFLNCIEIFGLVQLGRNFSEDFGSWHLQLNANELRFRRWGEAAGITDETSETFVKQLQKNYSLQDIKLAYNACDTIQTQLTRANEDSNKMSFLGDDPAELLVIDEFKQLEISTPDVKCADGALKRLKGRYQRGVRQVVVRSKWALYKKKQLEDLLRVIAEHVTVLENLFPHQAQALVAAEAKTLEPEDIKALKDVVSSSDPLLKDALREEAGSKGLSWNNIELNDYTTTHIGVMYSEAQQNGLSGKWSDIKARGHAVSHIGHVVGYQQRPHMQSAWSVDDDDFPLGNSQAHKARTPKARAQNGQGENDQAQNGQAQIGRAHV